MEEGHHSSYLIWAGRAVNVNPTTTHHRKTLGSDFIPQGLNPSYDFSWSPLGHGAVSLKCRCNTELCQVGPDPAVSRDGGLTARKTLTQVIRRRVNPPVSVCLFLFFSPHVRAFLLWNGIKGGNLEAQAWPAAAYARIGRAQPQHGQQGLLSQMG